MSFHCPDCGSIIYSRRHVLCGACGGRLPEHLLFSPAEREKVERDLAEAKERLRRARAKNQSGGPSGGFAFGGGDFDFGFGGDCGGGD